MSKFSFYHKSKINWIHFAEICYNIGLYEHRFIRL